MARRPDAPAAASAGPAADRASLAEQRVADQRLPWWRLRTWRRDLDALTRLRDGLQALDADPADDGAGGPQPSATGQAESPPAQASLVRPAPVAELSTEPSTEPSAVVGAAAASALSAGPAVAGPAPSAPVAADPADPAGAADAATSQPDAGIAAIRETFGRVAAAGDEAAGYFYAYLFLRRPQLRTLFPPAMDEQRDRLFRSLARIVESLSTPEEMASYLSQLGRDHRKYAVEPSMYDAVGEALIATLRAFAGPAFTPAAEEAWTQTYAAASALMIRAAEESAVASPAFWTAEVEQVDDRGNGIAVLTIAPDDVLPYEAGQHITVQTSRWPHVWRPYSIACRPREDGLITLHVKAVSGGWVSRALVQHTVPGDQLVLGPALGTMTLHPAGRRDLICVAGGTGLSPIKAIVEEAVRGSAAMPRQIFLFCGARTRRELYDLRDLWRLSDAYAGLQLTPVTSDDPAFDGMQGSVGRVAARYLPHSDCEAYVAGPPQMVRETIRMLGRAGIPRPRIHYDDALLAGRSRVGSGT